MVKGTNQCMTHWPVNHKPAISWWHDLFTRIGYDSNAFSHIWMVFAKREGACSRKLNRETWIEEPQPKQFFPEIRGIFLWPWNGNARTKQKQQTDRIRSMIWLVCGKDETRVAIGWLGEFSGEKLHARERSRNQSIYFALMLYCNKIGQSNNAFSTFGFSLAGERRVHVLIFSSTGW